MSIQEIIQNLFGGEIVVFGSVWDIIISLFFGAAGIFAIIYKKKKIFSDAMAKFQENKADSIQLVMAKTIDLFANKFTNVDLALSYFADIMVTIALSSPVLSEAAKKQISMQAALIKELDGIKMETVTEALLAAMKQSVEKEYTEKKEEILQTADAVQEKIEATEDTIASIIDQVEI